MPARCRELPPPHRRPRRCRSGPYGGVVAADGLVVAEVAVGDADVGLRVGNGATEAIVHEGTRGAGTAVATAAAEGLVVVEGAAGDGSGAIVIDGASFGDSDERTGPAIAADGLIAAEGAPRDGGGRREVDPETAPVGPTIGRVVAAAGHVVDDGAAGEGIRGCRCEKAPATRETVAAVVTAPGQVAAEIVLSLIAALPAVT